MKELFTYYEGDLDVFIAESLITKDALIKRVITIVSDTLISDLNDKGIVIDNTFRHTLDNNALLLIRIVVNRMLLSTQKQWKMVLLFM